MAQSIRAAFGLAELQVDIEDFYTYWKFPQWFEDHFRPVFDKHRATTDGKVIIAYERDRPVGTIYYELAPLHVSYGIQVPIFGWINADTEEICHFLIRAVEQRVKEAKLPLLRGPINPPAMYGGWGILTKDLGVPELVETSRIPKKMAPWIASAGYTNETEYYVMDHARVANLPCRHNKKGFYHLELTPQEILADVDLCNKMKRFIVKAFRSYLPDNTTADVFTEFWELMGSVPGGEAFYQCTMVKETDEIAVLIGHLPNIYQHWRGEAITRTNINTMIVGKAFRKSHLLHWVAQLHSKKLKKFGIHRDYGAYVWSGNKKAIRSFKTWCDNIGTWTVFQKEI